MEKGRKRQNGDENKTENVKMAKVKRRDNVKCKAMKAGVSVAGRNFPAILMRFARFRLFTALPLTSTYFLLRHFDVFFLSSAFLFDVFFIFSIPSGFARYRLFSSWPLTSAYFLLRRFDVFFLSLLFRLTFSSFLLFPWSFTTLPFFCSADPTQRCAAFFRKISRQRSLADARYRLD